MTTDITELAPAMKEIRFYAAGVIERDGNCERAREDEAQFWTVYERLLDGTEQAICDCDSRHGADAAAGRLNELVEALEYYKSREERVTKLVHDNSKSWDALYQQVEVKNKRIADLEPISAAAEKLVRCKGRYHSEQNYRALAELFGVNAPDLPPLDGESRTVTVSKSDIFNVPGGETYVGGEMISVDTLRLYLAEQGIKWEAE